MLLKFVLAMLPIIWLVIALSGLKMAGHRACVLAIGAGAIGAVGSESRILRAVFRYFLLYLVLAGVICYVGAQLGL